MTDYWVGFLTPFIAFAFVWAVLILCGVIADTYRSLGGFVKRGPLPASTTNWHSHLVVRGGFGVHVGVYRSTSGWGSRWLAIGTVTFGFRLPSLALSQEDLNDLRKQKSLAGAS